MALDAEAAADVGGDAADQGFRQFEPGGDFAADPVHDLGGGPDGHLVGNRVVLGEDAAAFDRHGGVAVVDEAAADGASAGGTRGRVAFDDAEAGDDVAVAAMHAGGAGAERGLEIGGGRVRFDLQRDQLERVFGDVAVGGDDKGDGLADMAHHAIGQERLVGDVDPVFDGVAPAFRRPALHAGDGRELATQVCGGEHSDDAVQREGRAGVECRDAAGGDRAAQEGDVQHAGQAEVGDVAAGAGDQRGRLPCAGRIGRRSAFPASTRACRAAATSVTAATMPA